MSMDTQKEDLLLQERLDKIRHTYLVLSGKGGVGKSTIAVNLALSLSLKGLKTGLLDVDIHGPSVFKLLGLTQARLGIEGQEIIPIEVFRGLKVVSMGLLLNANEEPVIWRGPLKASVIRQFVQDVAWGELDALVVDCPPGTGDEPLSVAQILGKKASAIIVTTPQQVATLDVEKCIGFCKRVDLPMEGIVENMSSFICPHCEKEVDIFSSGGGKNLALLYGIPFLGSIPLDPDVVRSGDLERPYVYYYSQSRTAQRFEEIVEKILAKEESSSSKEQEGGAVTSPPDAGKEAIVQNPMEGGNGIMRFAVPTYQGKFCSHFGHCESFAIIDVNEKGEILGETYLTPPPHEPGVIPRWLAQNGVGYVIAGGMGSRAQSIFSELGVKVLTGALCEDPREAVLQYLQGTLRIGQNICDH